MDPIVVVAIISAGGFLLSGGVTALSPIIQARLTHAQRQREREEDRADRLAVADKVDDAAREAAEAARLLSNAQKAAAQKVEEAARQARQAATLLAAAQQVSIAKTDEVAVAAAEATAETRGQLKQIHALVNSEKTEAQRLLLDQTKLTLLVLQRMVRRDELEGRASSLEDLAEIQTAEARITELAATITDREVQTKAAEAEAAAAKDALSP
jgi:hypothetical protein